VFVSTTQDEVEGSDTPIRTQENGKEPVRGGQHQRKEQRLSDSLGRNELYKAVEKVAFAPNTIHQSKAASRLYNQLWSTQKEQLLRFESFVIPRNVEKA